MMHNHLATPLLIGEHYRVGVGQVDDRGYLFVFSNDHEAAPYIRARDRIAMAGRNWMRKQSPRQWAAFCAARMLGTIHVPIVAGDPFETTALIDEADREWEHTVA